MENQFQEGKTNKMLQRHFARQIYCHLKDSWIPQKSIALHGWGIAGKSTAQKNFKKSNQRN